MFKLNIPITKSYKGDNGKLIVEGIASDPTIDRDKERFTEEAIQKMAACVNKGGVGIRVEHQNKFYTNVGKWTHADILDGDKLYVKGEVDTRLSLGNDIAVKLSDGEPLFLSVGGRVLDAAYEYCKELGHDIKAYKDVILEEISVLLTPSNYNTSLSIAKSVDWARVADPTHKIKSDRNDILSQKAITLFKQFLSMLPLDLDEFEKKALTAAERNKLPDSAFAYVHTNDNGTKVRKLPIHDATHTSAAIAALNGARGGVKGIPSSDMDAVKTKVDQAAKKFKVGEYAAKAISSSMDAKAKLPMMGSDKKKKGCSDNMYKWFEEVSAKVQNAFENPIEKDMGMPEPYDSECCEDEGMQPQDFLMLAQIANVMSNVELPDDSEVQSLWQDQEFLNTVSNIGEDGYIIMCDRSLMFPHHNLDYSVNEDWLLIQLKKLLTSYTWLSSKDFTIALNHMYKHLQELSLLKAKKQKPTDEKTLMKEITYRVGELNFTKEEIQFFSDCYKYRTESHIEVPKMNGTEATYSDVLKAAAYFEQLITNKDFISILNTLNMSDQTTEVKKEDEKPTAPAAEVAAPAEGVSPEEKKETEVTQKSEETPAAPEAKAEVPAAEEKAPEATPAKEEAPAPAPASEEVPATDPAKPEVEAPKEEKAAEKSVQKVEVETSKEFSKEVNDLKTSAESLTKALKEKSEELSSVKKSMTDLTTIVEKMSEKVQKAEQLEKTVSDLQKVVVKYASLLEKMATMSPGRKSYATAAEGFEALEKSFGADNEGSKTFEQLIEKHMKETDNNFTEAYKLAKMEIAQQISS